MSFNTNSDTETNGIRVEVFPEYLSERSDPGIAHYLFRYKIKITNNSDSGVFLLSRYWVIIDAEGIEEVVEGEGVIGYTPYIEPGNKFEYESFCPLKTPWGTMEGHYSIRTDEGNSFDVEIGRFYLCDLEPA